jgi:hypothetical protein
MLRLMADLLKLIWWVVIGLFRSRASLQAEIVALRHQLNVLRRKSPKRLTFNNFDRLIFASLYRIAPRIMNALAIVKPATVIRWHRAGFCLFWRKAANRAMLRLMVDLLKLIWWVVIGLFSFRRRSWRCGTSSMCCEENRRSGLPSIISIV